MEQSQAFRLGGVGRTFSLVRRCAIMLWFRSIPMRSHVRFLGRGKVYVNTGDNRGLWLRASAGVTQPLVTWLWRTLVRAWRPDVVVDVGANYGEIALSAAYETNVRIVLCEANPEVLPYLRRSCARHRNAAQITVLDFFAADREGSVEFVVDEKWSGTSSAVAPVEDAPFKGIGSHRARRIKIRSSPLAPHLAGIVRESDQRILIKIDVEGGEIAVLDGLQGILSRIPQWVLVTEHNPAALKAAGYSAAEATAFYHSLGDVFVWSTGGWLRRTASPEEVGPSHNDVVICKRGRVPADLIGSVRQPFLLRRRRLRS